MAEAMIKGIINAKLTSAEKIGISELDKKRRKHLLNNYQTKVFNNNSDLCDFADIVILAVKPQIMSTVLADCSGKLTENHLIISVAAGLPISYFEESLPLVNKPKIVRAMPNTPALVGESATAISVNPHVVDGDLEITKQLFNSIGTTTILEESLFDAVTGLCGSGPAYVFSFIEGLIDAGLAQGVARPVAEQLVVQTVLGSAKLLQETQEHPAIERARVTSPGGTSITGIQVLKKEGFQGIIMEAVAAAVKRAKELGEREKE